MWPRERDAAMTQPREISVETRAKVNAAVDRWKRQLLDVSRGNRALYYKRTVTTTVDIGGTGPSIWDTLVVRSAELTVAEPAADPPSAGSAGGRRPSGRLRALTERARVASEEQGAQILYVAIAWLTWVDERDPAAVRSPLFLIPVTLTADRPGTARVCAVENDDAEINPALAEFMRATFGVVLPTVARSDDENGQGVFIAALEAARAAINGRPGWNVDIDTPVLDVFSFRKVAIVQELERTREALAQSLLIRALAGDEAVLSELPRLPGIGDPDADIPAASVRLVTSADSSQLRAIASAQQGASLVVQGPPGTGKSQTITNLIGEFLAEGKTVLFVAEKAVARTVVYENLQTAGLAAACLHVAVEVGTGRSASVGKESVLASLVTAYEEGPGTYPVDDSVPTRVEEVRAQLTALTDTVHAPLGLGGWTSAYYVLGKADVSAPATTEPILPEISTIDGRWLPGAAEGVARLADVPQRVEALRRSPWRSLRLAIADPRVEEMTAAAEELSAARDAVDRCVGSVSVVLAKPGEESLVDLSDLGALLVSAGSLERLQTSPFRWFRPAYRRAKNAPAALTARWGWSASANDAMAGAELVRTCAEAVRCTKLLVSELSEAPPVDAPRRNLLAWARALVDAKHELADVNAGRRAISSIPVEAQPVVEKLLRSEALPEDFVASFSASVWRTWAERLVSRLPDLEPSARQRLAQEFADADKEYRRWSRLSVLNGAYARRPDPAEPVSPTQGLGRLLRLSKVKRRPALRRIFAEAPESILRLKPCLLMSPLAVAQYLGGGASDRYKFDVCIVDEASMIPTADLVLAAARCSQIVVMGDSKQLPPTSFFEKSLAYGFDPDDETEVFESILDELSTQIPTVRLNWHYRSRAESLIAFSNAAFYEGRLITFPSADSEADAGVVVRFAHNAVYGRGGSRANPVEALTVAEALLEELRQHPEREVAVTAMSLAQQDEINAQIERLGDTDPAVKRWVSEGGRAKNLEMIQGDECDTMILSLGYGRDAAGKLILNFGPLGRTGGERRLNVAVTRARWKTVVVTSIGSADIPADANLAQGALRLRDYLAYAELGPAVLSANVRINADAETESPFETAVLRRLVDAGIPCQPQVGVGAFRIDIGIYHPDQPGRFILGVECDGASYHNTKCARDRDLLRQEVLERMGWRIHRIWSTCWYRDPQKEVDAILAIYHTALSQGRSAPIATPSPAPVQVDPPFLKRIGLPDGVVEWDNRPPFQRAAPLLARTASQLDADLRELVLLRGPIHREDLFRLLARAHGQTLGSRIRVACEQSVARSKSARRIAVKADFLWPAGLAAQDVVVRRSAAAGRPTDRIPVEEAVRALWMACGNAESLAEADLAHTLASFMGFARAGSDLQVLAAGALKYGITAGWLKVDGGVIRALPSGAPKRDT